MLSDYEKLVFPAILVFFSHVGYQVVYFFSFMFLLLFVFLVLLVSSLKQLLCVCVVWFSFFVAGLSGFVLCILWSCFRFCCFVFKFLFLLHCSQEITKKADTAKTQKSKNPPKKTDIFSVSAVVFTNSVANFLGVGFKNADFC